MTLILSLFQISVERLDQLLGVIGPLTRRKDTDLLKSILATERLMLTMRFLASGNSLVSLFYLFRMGKKSLSRIVSENSKVIVQVLLQDYMSPPKTELYAILKIILH